MLSILRHSLHSPTSSLAFGSTHTLNPVSIATGFCDQWDSDDWTDDNESSNKEGPRAGHDSRLACLDDIMNDIEYSSVHRDPWKNFPTLKSILRDRVDWNSVRLRRSVKTFSDFPSSPDGIFLS